MLSASKAPQVTSSSTGRGTTGSLVTYAPIGLDHYVEIQKAIEQRRLAIEVGLAVALIRNRFGTML